MKNFIKWGRILFTLYGLVLFLAFLFLFFPLVIVASFFGKLKGGNFIYKVCRLWADLLFPLGCIFHTNYFEMPHDRSKPSVFVFNHTSYLDIPIIMKSIRKQHVRILGKSEMAKIPVFGFLYRNAVVMVERNNPAKRAKSVLQLKSILKKNISIVISPEGTFNTTGQPLKEFYDGAFRIAIETQTPIKPVLFLDAYKRMNNKNFFSLNPGRSRAVYLAEISTRGLNLKDQQYLKQKVYDAMEEGLIRYKASWIKTTDHAKASTSVHEKN